MKFDKLISLAITTSIISTSILVFNTNASAATTNQEGNSTVSTTTQNVDNLPMLKNSSTGQYVYLLQSYLNIVKIGIPQLPSTFSQLQVDGIFGSETLNDIKIYQKYKNLTVDGIVGQETWKSLQSNIGCNYK